MCRNGVFFEADCFPECVLFLLEDAGCIPAIAVVKKPLTEIMKRLRMSILDILANMK
jgi:hypothetical protein